MYVIIYTYVLPNTDKKHSLLVFLTPTLFMVIVHNHCLKCPCCLNLDLLLSFHVI